MLLRVVVLYTPLALLLINYRCHASILRLPSYLLYDSTLQAKSDVSLHPKTSSALVFVCTSIDSKITTSKEDFSQEEARITLGQVSNIVLCAITRSRTRLQ